MLRYTCCLAALVFVALPVASPAQDDPLADMPRIAAKVDEIMAAHWQAHGVTAANVTDDAAFLRRVTLDLAGRIPTPEEAKAFYADTDPNKRANVIRRLIAGPEFPLHFAHVLDRIIQAEHAGDGAFVDWLRESLQQRRSWDAMFRQMLVGPWDTPEDQRANRFLLRRVNSQDDMTRDTARVFFGVDISCAKCHDHPLVEDWKQEHYFGMQAFFNRTMQPKGKKDFVGENALGEVEFVAHRDGQKRIARIMFLNDRVIDEPPLNADPRFNDRRKAAEEQGEYVEPLFSRRSQLVDVALEEGVFFQRALVNRLWHYLHGSGLVDPVDQMHSGNPPAVEGVLAWLGEDFATHGYQIDRVVAGLVAARAYQLSSIWESDQPRPARLHFAVANVRPLTPLQYATIMVQATGDEVLQKATNDEELFQKHRELENRARGFAGPLDVPSEDFQSSVTEALYLSNHPSVQQLVLPAGNNLAARLLKLEDDRELVETAVWTVFSRPPAAGEQELLSQWLADQAAQADNGRPRAVSNLLWALITSGEFRFNH